MYLVIFTRPEISFAIAVIARQMHFSKMRYLFLVRKVLHFTAGEANYVLTDLHSVQNTTRSILSHCDAYWSGFQKTENPLRGGSSPFMELVWFGERGVKRL